MQLTPQLLHAFKDACPENVEIAQILRMQASSWIIAPVADIGAGRGDIAQSGLDQVECTLVDILDFSSYDIAKLHRRLQVDALAATAGDLGHPNTLLLSHVVQFLDDRPAAFKAMLSRLAAQRLLIVQNDNTGVMGSLVEWSLGHLPNANPEIDVSEFLEGYVQTRSWPFQAVLRAQNRDDLARRALHLVDVQPEHRNVEEMSRFLRSQGIDTSLTIHQTVRGYERESISA